MRDNRYCGARYFALVRRSVLKGIHVIERYSRPQMVQLWSDEAKFRTWLDIEVLVCEALASLGSISQDEIKAIRSKATFSTEEILKREEKTKHDVAAFVSVVQESIGPAGKHIHYGLTSSDIVDTAFSYRLTKSADIVLAEIKKVQQICRERALSERDFVMIGRTHGMHAEPITMGLKWLLWYDLLERAHKRLLLARKEIAVGKLSGAVGTYAHLPPEVEQFVCKRLGLEVDSLSTQVIARDRYANYFCALGILGAAIETIATELRHLQRTELREVEEEFTAGQKGSSAMPHKRNPISAENLTGLARLLRSMVIPALENCALWHERDISHSSVERVNGPDANILADYMLSRLGQLLSRLKSNPNQMKKNLDLLHGVVYSQKALLALVEAGLTRDQAYEIIQENTHKALDTETSLLELLSHDKRVTKFLAPDALAVLFQPQHYLVHMDYLYKKVLNDGN